MRVDFRGLKNALALGFALSCLSGCGTTADFRDPSYSAQEFKSGPAAFVPMRFTEMGMGAYEEFRKAFDDEPEGGGETKLAKAFLDAMKPKAMEMRILDSGPMMERAARKIVLKLP